MIDKLRKKVVAINVLSVCIVFFLAMLLLFSIGYSRIDAERVERMKMLLDYEVSDADFYNDKAFSSITLVEYDLKTKNTNWYFGKDSLMDKEQLAPFVEKAVSSSEDFGYLSARLTYVKKPVENDVVRIAFNNRYSAPNSLTPYFIFALGILVVGVCCYLIISLILARVALKPVEESWNKQKQFVADASHELKTPLSVIMANTEIIASHQDETVASQMKWIENTREESKRMAALVADLLFLAKNDDGLKVQMETVNVSDCVETTALNYDAVFYENGKTFNYRITPDLKIIGNSGQIKQLVTILLDNANKYSVGVGNIKMSLTVTNRHIMLSVSNDSEELSEEQLSHIFDSFYTVDKSRNTDKGGNGLGLSIAQTICQTHDGDIKVNYFNGRTSFIASFPNGKVK